MKQIRKRLTYANVMSSIALFLVLGGATAFAANQLGKNSVGTKQLKKNAVTAAKIKKNAVTGAKIRKGSINASKIIDGSISGADLDLASTPFSRVVARFRNSGPVAIGVAAPTLYPLPNPTYTQGADELNTYYGAVDITYQPTCKAPRSVSAYLTVDLPDPTKLASENDITGLGMVEDKAGVLSSQRIEVGPYVYLGTKFEPGTPKARTVAIVLVSDCDTGSGVTATSAAVDVVGTR